MIDPRKMTDEELGRALVARGADQEALFEQARAVRKQTTGDAVTIRGVLEISNACSKNCMYCAMRHSNKALRHYRMDAEWILEIARRAAADGIGCFFLQSAQDEQMDAVTAEVIPRIKRELGMDVLLCLGERTAEQYRRFAELGADGYILKFETSNPKLYTKLCCGHFARRQECAQYIRAAGLKFGTGNITGLPGQDLASAVQDVRFGMEERPDFMSSAPFMPNDGTPYEREPLGDLNLTLNTMALWRIALGGTLIPAVSAMQKAGEDGQYRGLMAGANVVTVNYTPHDVRGKYRIYASDRFVVSLDHAKSIVRRAGLKPILPLLAKAAAGPAVVP